LGEQAYETAIYIYDICSGVRAIRFLGSVFATARFFLVTADIIFFFLGSFTSRWMFEGLHCIHLPAPTVVHDFEQLTMSGTGATGALTMGPSPGYISILKFVKFNLFFALISMLFMNIFAANLSSSKITHVHISVITNLLLFLWINFNMKMPKFLIIQKSNIRQFFVSGFAAALKLDDFDGTNYRRTRAKMNCYHATEGNAEQFTPD